MFRAKSKLNCVLGKVLLCPINSLCQGRFVYFSDLNLALIVECKAVVACQRVRRWLLLKANKTKRGDKGHLLNISHCQVCHVCYLILQNHVVGGITIICFVNKTLGPQNV